MKTDFQFARKLAALCFTVAIGLHAAADAATLSLASAQTEFSVGDTLSVDLNISDLGSHALGGFDVALTWSNNFQFVNGTFGTGLGNTAFDTFTNLDSYHLQVSQLSLETAADLLNNQPDAFTLATMNFLVKPFPEDSGGNIILFSEPNTVLTDEFGNAISYKPIEDFSIGTILPFTRKDEQPAAVPLPATWILFSAGFGLVEGLRLWSARKKRT